MYRCPNEPVIYIDSWTGANKLDAGIDATQTSASVTSKTLGTHNDWRPSQAIRPWPGHEKARNAARCLGGSG
ncbi:oxidoreductase ptaK [Fusarium oxysporum f. sp. albedinis]|nr:oxidoreductase ptaK [Fusarium oxysporum f. sp. albedinis]